jgi:hypothetical protein
MLPELSTINRMFGRTEVCGWLMKISVSSERASVMKTVEQSTASIMLEPASVSLLSIVLDGMSLDCMKEGSIKV